MLVLILLLLEQTTFTYAFVEHIYIKFHRSDVITMTYKNIIVLLGAVYNGASQLGCVSCHSFGEISP